MFPASAQDHWRPRPCLGYQQVHSTTPQPPLGEVEGEDRNEKSIVPIKLAQSAWLPTAEWFSPYIIEDVSQSRCHELSQFCDDRVRVERDRHQFLLSALPLLLAKRDCPAIHITWSPRWSHRWVWIGTVIASIQMGRLVAVFKLDNLPNFDRLSAILSRDMIWGYVGMDNTSE